MFPSNVVLRALILTILVSAVFYSIAIVQIAPLGQQDASSSKKSSAAHDKVILDTLNGDIGNDLQLTDHQHGLNIDLNATTQAQTISSSPSISEISVHRPMEQGMWHKAMLVLLCSYPFYSNCYQFKH